MRNVPTKAKSGKKKPLTDGGDSSNDLSKLQLIKDCSFTSGILGERRQKRKQSSQPRLSLHHANEKTRKIGIKRPEVSTDKSNHKKDKGKNIKKRRTYQPDHQYTHLPLAKEAR